MQNIAMHLFVELSRFTAMAFVSGLWQGLAMIAVVAVCLRLLPGVSATIRFAIWASAFVLLAAVPLLHFPAATIRHQSAPSPMVHIGAAFGFVIAGIWAALIVLRICQLLIQTIRLRRIWKNATPAVAPCETLAMLQKARRSATLCTSADVDAPSVIGFFSPRLLIPEWMFARLSESELRQVVLHECEHLRRRDDWMNLLQKIALALFPLNPALLWVDRRLSLERELACDAGVVASTAAPYDYANCLTRLAEHRMVRRRIALSLSAWSRQSELAHRVQTLLRPMRRISTLQARVSIALLGLSLVGLSLEMARAPRFVSFEDGTSLQAMDQDAVTSPHPAVAYATAAGYGDARLPNPRLLQASLPMPTTSRVSATSSQAFGIPTQSAKRRVRAAQIRLRPSTVLLTTTQPVAKSSIHPSRPSSGRPVYAMDIKFSPSYAAVPFGDGWLLIRL